MMVALKFIFIIFCCYLIGNINFAKIISFSMHHNDITKEGSGNPGVMNVLRTHGLKEGLIVLLCDTIKAGLPALLSYFILKNDGIADVGYFIAGLCVVLGHNFPMIYNFKGGKGVACTFGTFLFNPHFWWVSMIVFVVGFLLFLVIQYPFIISFFAITSLVVYATIFFVINKYSNLIILLILIWLFFVFTIIMHRKNIVRLFQGKENKINFRSKVKSFFTGKNGIEIIEEHEVNVRDPRAEEIVVYDLPRAKVKTPEEIKEEKRKKKENKIKNKKSKKEKENRKTVCSEEIKENNDLDENLQNENLKEFSSDEEFVQEDNVEIQEQDKETQSEEEKTKEEQFESEVDEQIIENISEIEEEQTEKINLEEKEELEESNIEDVQKEEIKETINDEPSLENSTDEKTEEKASKVSKPKKERKLKFYQQTSIFENKDGEEN